MNQEQDHNVLTKADFIGKLRGQLRASSEQQSCTQSAQNQESYVLAQSCSERPRKPVHEKMRSERLFSG